MKKISYFLQYILFKIFYFIFSSISIDNASNIAGKLLKILGPISKNNYYIKFNLKLVYKYISDQEIRKKQLKIWENFGRYIGEFCHVFNISKNELQPRVEIENFDAILSAKTDEKFLFLSAHLANWDFGLVFIKNFRPNLSAIYRHINNPYIDKEVRKIRNNLNINLIKKGIDGSKDLLRAIKSNSDIVMMADQKMEEGIDVDFLNLPAKTSISPAKIARNYDYKIVFCRVIRKEGANFKIIFSDPIIPIKSDDIDHDILNMTKMMNDFISNSILDNPIDWLWMHQRWGKIKEIEKFNFKK